MPPSDQNSSNKVGAIEGNDLMVRKISSGSGGGERENDINEGGSLLR